MKEIIKDIKTVYVEDRKEFFEILGSGILVFAIGFAALIVAFAFGG